MELSKRQIQKEQTRNKILETALRVYSEQGFSATTSTIAKEANVSHGTIFVHFPTLNDLLICLIQEFGAKVSGRLHELVRQNSNLREVLKTHVAVLSESEAFYSRLITELGVLPDESRDTFAAIQSTVSYHFSEAFERGKKLGKIKDLPMHLLFNTWVGLLHYYLQNKNLFSPHCPILQKYGTELINIFLELIKETGGIKK